MALANAPTDKLANRAAFAASRIGTLSTVDALGSSAGLVSGLLLLRTAQLDKNVRTIFVCVTSVIAGTLALVLASRFAFFPTDDPPSPAGKEGTEGKEGMEGKEGGAATSRWRVHLANLVLTVGVGMMSTGMQLCTDRLRRSEAGVAAAIDPMVDNLMRFVLQVLLAAPLCRAVSELGGTIFGGSLLLLAALVGLAPSGRTQLHFTLAATHVIETCTAALACAYAPKHWRAGTLSLMHAANALTPHFLPDAEMLAGAAIYVERTMLFCAAFVPLLLMPLLPAEYAFFTKSMHCVFR